MRNKSNKRIAIFGIIFIMVVGIFATTSLQDVSATKQVKSSGTNNEAMNLIIQNRLNDNASVNEYSGSWQEYLDNEYRRVENNFSWNRSSTLPTEKWSGGKSNTVGGPSDDPKDNPALMPSVNADGYVEVYYGEQLAYALTNTSTNKKIKIMNDIDLIGYEKDWAAVGVINLEKVIIDGNGKIIYNLGSTKSFINSMKQSEMMNLSFDSAKIVSDSADLLGIVGNFSNNNGKKSKLDHVRVQNSLFFSAVTSGYGAYVAPFAEAKDVTANYVGTSNNVVYAYKAHAGGAFGITNTKMPENETDPSKRYVINNSYSIDSTVIAGGNHSGGFVSCSDGAIKVANSFTNNTVYGNELTGVFIGAILPQTSDTTSEFVNCFSSGTIEGTNQLGGFIGQIQPQKDNFGDIASNYSFIATNCYSTSIVGMRKGGENLGGFIGSVSKHNYEYTFKDCFAAGEVGSIDTDVSPTRSKSFTAGGFIGSFNKNELNTFTNCYYDKQTTAMREWATGDTSGGGLVNAGSLDYIDDDAKGTNTSGIKGTLTSDSIKFGAGLASQPKKEYTDIPGNLTKSVGFSGFSGDSYNGPLAINPNWIYDGGNTNANSHNCMYPQLKVFYDSGDALVRAYSYASVSTVHEQVWDTCTHGGELPRATYDTVRDLTSRFTLTSYVDNNAKNETVDINWSKSNAKSNLYGKELNVIQTFEQIKSSKYNRDYWTADKFAPGTEWVTVTFDVTDALGKTATGSRRLRIIPTSNMEAGNDYLDATVGGTYNHANDSYYAYSTAHRMSVDANDITTGVYPDELPFATGDPRETIQDTSSQKIKDLFTTYNDKYQVSAEFMSNVAEGIDKNHKDNIINVYVYDVKKFQEITGTDKVEIIYLEEGESKENSAILSPDLLVSNDPAVKAKAEAWAKKLNGKEEFISDDEGRYLIEYEWIRTDGRYMRDAKMVSVKPLNHKVELKVKNLDETDNNGSLKLSAVTFDNDTRPSTDFSASTISSLEKTIKHSEFVDLAFKNVNPDATIEKIKFNITTKDFDSEFNKQEVTIENLVIGQEFSVPISYYYSSYEEGGKYYAKKVTTDRKYKLQYDSVNSYYYLTMNNEFVDKETGLKRTDLESDVKITIYVSDDKAINTGGVTISNKTFLGDLETKVTDTITYTIKDAADILVGTFALDSTDDNNSKVFTGLEVGTYTFERTDSDKYNLRDIVIDQNTPVTESPTTFEVVTDGNTEIVVNNVKVLPTKGSVKVVNKTFNGSLENHVSEEIEYAVYDNANAIVGSKFTLTSEDAAKSIKTVDSLTPGTYTLKRFVKDTDKYKLRGMSIDGGSENSTDNPIEFVVVAGAETEVVVNNTRITEGKVKITNQTFKNGTQTYVEDKISYVIKDSKGNAVGKSIELSSKDAASSIATIDKLKEGTYTIVRQDSTDYRLLGITVGTNAEVTTSSATFEIKANEETAILVKNEQVVRGDITITNKTFENMLETHVTDTISYVVKDSEGNEVEAFALDSKDANSKELKALEVGTYIIERKVSSQYTLESIVVDGGTPITTSTATFTIVEKGNTNIVVNNVKVVPPVDKVGSVSITNKTFENGVETNVDEAFHFIVRDKDDVIIDEFYLNSNDYNWKQLDLPVGEYSLERVVSSTYNLKDITVDKIVSTNNKVDFVIVENGKLEIIVRNELVTEVEKPEEDPKDIPGTGDHVDAGDRQGKYIPLYALLVITSGALLLFMKEKRRKGMRYKK